MCGCCLLRIPAPTTCTDLYCLQAAKMGPDSVFDVGRIPVGLDGYEPDPETSPIYRNPQGLAFSSGRFDCEAGITIISSANTLAMNLSKFKLEIKNLSFVALGTGEFDRDALLFRIMPIPAVAAENDTALVSLELNNGASPSFQIEMLGESGLSPRAETVSATQSATIVETTGYDVGLYYDFAQEKLALYFGATGAAMTKIYEATGNDVPKYMPAFGETNYDFTEHLFWIGGKDYRDGSDELGTEFLERFLFENLHFDDMANETFAFASTYTLP